MGVDTAPTAPAPERSAEAASRRRRAQRRGLLAARGLCFTGAAGLILVYGLRGGSYDIVVFEEHGLVIWWALAVGLAVGLLPRSRPSRPAVLLLGALAAYASWTTLSLSWTQSSERTFEELARCLDYLGIAALAVCVLDRDTWRAAAAGLAFGAILVCVVALGSHLAPTVFGTDHLDSAFHIDRLSVPFGYWNAVAAFGAMCVAIGLAWSAHDTARLKRSVALACVPLAVTATYLTYSRAGVFGVGTGVLAVLLLSRNRITAFVHIAVAAAASALVIVAVRSAPQIAHATGTSGASSALAALTFAAALGAVAAFLTSVAGTDGWTVPRVARPVGAVAAIILIGAAVGFGPRLISRGWHSFTRPAAAQASADPAARLSSLSSSRYPLWKASLHAFEAHPAGGTGAGTLEFWWNQHATDNEFVHDAHNIWLQNMAELGLPGLILIVSLALIGIGVAVVVRKRARRRTSAGVAAAFGAAFLVYLVHASVDWMWESTAVTVLALAGVAVLTPRLATPTAGMRLPWRALFASLALSAAAVQVPGLLATTDIRNSQAAERAGNTASALGWANNAIDIQPWAASAYEQRALVRERSGDLHGAQVDLGQSISYEPTNYRHWLIRARVDAEQASLRSATSDYARARQLRPRASVFALGPYFARR